jgi:CRP-like cAMP-binding protein
MSEGEFFGEGCIAGQRLRTATAIAMEPTSVLEIGKHEMIRVFHNESGFSDRFVSHMLARNVRIEEDLTDQLAQPAKGTVSSLAEQHTRRPEQAIRILKTSRLW